MVMYQYDYFVISRPVFDILGYTILCMALGFLVYEGQRRS